MAADGFDLLLAGHTHGGQVCVPGVGALVTNCGLDRRMARGLHRWPGTDVLAARLGRPRHPPDRPGPVRLPAGGDPAHADPALTSVPIAAGYPVCGPAASATYCSARLGVWRSLVARFVRDEEVVGSNPATPTEQSARQDPSGRPLPSQRHDRPPCQRRGQRKGINRMWRIRVRRF